MSISCSLYPHIRGYSFSRKEALVSPIISPYAVRHLRLSYSQEISKAEKWGHRVIATIQFIPIIGLLASLIERVAVLIIRLFLSKTPEPTFQSMPQGDDDSMRKSISQSPTQLVQLNNDCNMSQSEEDNDCDDNVTVNQIVQAPDHVFNRLDGDSLGRVSEFLNLQESSALSSLMRGRDAVWQGQARRLKFHVPSGMTAESCVRSWKRILSNTLV